MESMLLGIGGVVVVFVVFGLLSRIEAGRRRRMIADVTRERRFDLVGELLPSENVSLGAVDYRRIPATAGYERTTQQARHAPTVETLFVVPALTAFGTALAITMTAGGLALLFGWPARTVGIVCALSLGVGWFWRLGVADKVLWRVESWAGRDVNGDGSTGRPALGFATIDGAVARTSVARQTAQNATETRLEALQTFVDRCYLSGTSEAAHGVLASGPERDDYVACRDELLKLGLAQWKNKDRAKSGWVMTTDPATAKAIVSNHVA